ncbi:methyl-accepting chemotaxis protein [Lichenifustis flavocetrariae]|uniref:Methyl-accepting chemotaxis protein n=1 Tax=Lichenifustis flavocetrariae TaxID=2949735 RepID=A0AA41Z3G6_9HYPH|nr:methyl-accepting chemotaxis protein [Lichenifustis flavocetrariae]MCW6512208.1 methyl-accepting chemotaxis protein [Lichenifustis flavocetrariae]
MFASLAAWATDEKAVLKALGCSLAIIEFDPSGTILTANENFCKTLGYDLAEIKGQHHRIFVDPAEANGGGYKAFWSKLARGEFHACEYKRSAKGGREVWIQASYNPVMNAKGVVNKVVKVATNITAEKLKNAEFESKLNAISRVQAVIEFSPGGEIITANANFLALLGYQLDEIKGQHHRMFVAPSEGQSPDYEAFWRKLNSGEAISASFKRIGKGGKEVWIQASYNPIFDMNGKVTKVVKFANDITDLTEIGAGLARLADNKIDQRIDKAFSPTFEKLRVDFNIAHDKLQQALLHIADGTTAIHAGALQISTAADDLSHRTEQQAASLEETAAALDQITATLKKSADGATHARDVVSAADRDAKTSAIVVRQAVEAMDAIATSARQISQIIGVIDEIAFQTNLLALNAGVEAARAGDAGRGFAVVASEVRALAQRSAEAAKEIKSLISASSTQVDTGVKLVAETGKSLDRILGQVTEINGVMDEIASGAKEQSAGLAEVNIAVNQMDQVTQQNAAMVEETTAASHSLSQEAMRLSGLLAEFQIGRPEGEPSIRSALQKAVPHAFRSTATGMKPSRDAGPAKRAARGIASRSNPQSAATSQTKVVNGAPLESGSGAWEEF